MSPGEFLGRLIKGNSYFIILAACLLLLMAITSAQGLHMATGIETLVFKDTQIYRDIDYYNENFQSTTFLILVTTDDVLDPQVIDAMARLETQILTNPRVTGVTGLQTFTAQAQSTGLLNNRANIAQMIENLPPEVSRFLVLDPHHTIMTVTLRGDVEEEDQPPVLEDVRNAIRWVPMPPGTSAVLTGSTAMMLEVQKEMMSSLMTMLATAVLLMVLALWFTFSHSRWRLLPLPIVLVGVIYTTGVMGVTGVPITMVSMAVFPILIGLGVEYAIQFQNRMMEELADGKATGDAIVATVKNIGPAVAFSVMTTCLGFSSILSSTVPMIYDFGLMCLIGVIVCFLTALFLLLSVLAFLMRRQALRDKAIPCRRCREAHRAGCRDDHPAPGRYHRRGHRHDRRICTGPDDRRGDGPVHLRSAGPAVSSLVPQPEQRHGVQDRRYGHTGQSPRREQP